jgi:hypothetical protein
MSRSWAARSDGDWWAARSSVQLGCLQGYSLAAGKNVVFVAKFDDGQKMLASAESKTFTAIQAAAFNVTAR